MAIQQLPLPKTGIPSGNTAGRPASPVIGDVYYNGETTELEIYSSSGWVPAQKNWNQENNYVPAAPNIGVATAAAAAAEATVTWSFNFNGGKSITAITITPYLNGTTAQTPQTAATGTATSHVFTGLTGGSNYTFTVKLTNSNGVSAESVQSNSVTIVNTVTVEALVIAGGGGGGSTAAAYYSGAGAGAGGFLYFPSLLLAGPNTITVGAGGAAGISNGDGTNGSNSRIGTATLVLGGGGGKGVAGGPGISGGSGGGAVANAQVGLGTAGQGNNGGVGNQGGGGGGGAGAVGGSGDTPQGIGRPGGAGSGAYSSWATATSSGVGGFYAGGGGGGYTTYYLSSGIVANGGSGGGGTGGGEPSGAKALISTAGTANTGGGGGGGGGYTGGAGLQPAREGGSGIVIIRYSDALPALTSTTGSPSVYVTGGYRYYKFTSSGSVTV
jgi:hypothetical protein